MLFVNKERLSIFQTLLNILITIFKYNWFLFLSHVFYFMYLKILFQTVKIVSGTGNSPSIWGKQIFKDLPFLGHQL